MNIAYIGLLCNPFVVGARYHHGQLKQAILEASREILAESGAAGLSLREAARRAGVSSAAPYRHFKDKQSLLVSLAQQAFARLDAELAATHTAHADESALERVRHLGVTYVAFAARHPAEFRLMFGELAPAATSSEELAAATASASSHLPRVIAELARDVGPDAPPIEDLTLLAWSVVHGLATLHLDGHLHHFPGDGAEAVAARITGVLIGALRGQLTTG